MPGVGPIFASVGGGATGEQTPTFTTAFEEARAVDGAFASAGVGAVASAFAGLHQSAALGLGVARGVARAVLVAAAWVGEGQNARRLLVRFQAVGGQAADAEG